MRDKCLSGEPYFNHLFETAKSLVDLGMDTTSVVAGFLHDTLEDTKTSAETIKKNLVKRCFYS